MQPLQTSASRRPPDYDVLFVGEQTSLVMRLIAELAGRGQRVAVLNDRGLIERLRQECKVCIDGFTCPEVRLPGRYRAPLVRMLEKPIQRARLRDVLQRVRPAVIHLNYIRADQALLTELNGDCPPTVATVWGTDLNRDAAAAHPRQRAAIARVLQQAGVITADSRHLLERARHLAPAKSDRQLQLVLWGIDVGCFAQVPPTETARWRQQLAIAPHSPVVLAPRRINPRYAPERVLHAFARCRTPGAVLVYKIFGDHPKTEGRQQDMLLKLAAEHHVLDRVRFAPPTPYNHLPGLYRMADVACFLLSHDGTPTTAFELMAGGVPLVTADIPDYNGMLLDGRHARLVPPEDVDAVAAELDRALQQPEAFASQCRFAREWVRRNADMDTTATRFINAYRQAAGRDSN